MEDFLCYKWGTEQQENGTDIFAWCLNKNSEKALVIIEGFRPWLYLDVTNMPQVLENISVLNDFINSKHRKSQIRKNHKLSLDMYSVESHRKFYMKDDKLGTFIKITTYNEDTLGTIANLLKKPVSIRGKEYLIPVCESTVTTCRRFWTDRRIDVCGWFSVKNLEEPLRKITTLKHEYVVDYHNISKSETAHIVHPMVFSYDIECYSDNHNALPKAELTDHVINAISVVTEPFGLPDQRQIIVLVLGHTNASDLADIIEFHSERDLLKYFMELIREINPVILTGWNINGFDNRYLNTRIKKHFGEWLPVSVIKGDIPVLQESDLDSSGTGKNKFSYMNWSDMITIDLMTYFLREHNLPDYRLETVSNTYLNEGKNDLKVEEMFRIHELYLESKRNKSLVEESRKRTMELVSYNIQDSVLVMKLFDKFNVWYILTGMGSVMGINPEDVYLRGQGVRSYSQIVNLASLNDTVVGYEPPIVERYDGAFVYKPVKGKHPIVICFDFKSLYPSIIIAYNVCPSTLIPEDQWNLYKEDDYWELTFLDYGGAKETKKSKKDVTNEENDASDESDNEADNGKTAKTRKITNDIEKEWRYCHPDTMLTQKEIDAELAKGAVLYRFRFLKQKIRQGIVPMLAEKLLSERKQIREAMKTETDPIRLAIMESRQLALKVGANSVYGLLGNSFSKTPFYQGAMFITHMGKRCNLEVYMYLRDKYLAKTVYGDTDSLFTIFPNLKMKDIAEFGKKMAKEISAMFPPPVEIDFEKAIKVILLEKKKYIGTPIKDGKYVYDPKKMLIKGVILARREQCKYVKDVYRKIASMCLEDKFLDEILDAEFEAVYDLLERKVDYHDLQFVIKISGKDYKQPGFWAKVFKDRLTASGKPPDVGDRIKYLIIDTTYGQYLSKQKEAKKGTKCYTLEEYEKSLETDKPLKIDYLKYIESMSSPFDQLVSIAYAEAFAKMGGNFKPYRARNTIPYSNTMEIIGRKVRDSRYQADEMFTQLEAFHNEIADMAEKADTE